MKTEFIFDTLSKAEFRARVQNNSAQNFLTMISIIQGVAFYFLINNAIPLFTSGQLRTHREFLLYPLISFASIITIFFLYSWFVSITYRPPELREATIPFVVGLTQIIPMHFFADPKHWFAFFALFLLASIVALHNTVRGLHPQDFGADFKEAYDISCKEEWWNICICAFLACISVIAWRLYPDTPLSFTWHDWVPMSIITAGTVFLAWKSQVYYLNPLYRIYGLRVPVAQPSECAAQTTASAKTLEESPARAPSNCSEHPNSPPN